MKVAHIISRAEDYLSSDKRKLKTKIRYLKQVLKALRKREKKLQARLEEGVSSQEKMHEELALIHAQRSKGVLQLKALKAERKARKRAKKSGVAEREKDLADYSLPSNIRKTAVTAPVKQHSG